MALGGKVFARRIYGSQKGRTGGGECQLWTKGHEGKTDRQAGVEER